MDPLKIIIEQRKKLSKIDREGAHYTSTEYNYSLGFEDGLQYVYDIIKELEDPKCTNVVTD
jgi:hypothetical protein